MFATIKQRTRKQNKNQSAIPAFAFEKQVVLTHAEGIGKYLTKLYFSNYRTEKSLASVDGFHLLISTCECIAEN